MKTTILLLWMALQGIYTLYAQNKDYVKPLNGIEKIIIKTKSCHQLRSSSDNQLTIGYCCDDSPEISCGCVDAGEEIEETKGLTMVSSAQKDDTNGYLFSLTTKGKNLIISDLNEKIRSKCIRYTIPEHVSISTVE